MNNNEKLFLNELFIKQTLSVDTSNESDSTKKFEVTSSELYNNFYKTMEQILYNINSKENKYKLFSKPSFKKLLFIILMLFITFCVITIPPILKYNVEEIDLIFCATLFSGFGFTMMFSMLFGNMQTIYVNGVGRKALIKTKLSGMFMVACLEATLEEEVLGKGIFFLNI